MEASPKLALSVILGSTRENRVSEQVAPWVLDALRAYPEFDPAAVDLRDHALPFFDEPIAPGDMVEPYTNPVVLKWQRTIEKADAFLIIAPEYNRGYPAVLKNALDWAYKEWNNKPVAFVAYGGVGGARSVEQLRLVTNALEMYPIRQGVFMPERSYIGEGGSVNTDAFKSFDKPLHATLKKLLWWGKVLKDARNSA